ncbi:efflux RND transporter periplasmic adaptor subunit [Cupriavidus campinensis]|uniref:efflux RND transporter periplasmic adaptor subunit n=1 Tax=Cupriavidus campinensis TaxID=151783 RepID=UPI0011EC0EBF|nr:efflux RND transporter periplasmic adaptor subunit [Cupriavidus campinensis]
MHSLNKRQLALAATVVMVIGTGGTLWHHGSEVRAAPAATPPTVKFKPALERSLSDTQDYTGRLEAVDVVDVRPKVPGTLLAVHFKDGQRVRQGDPLFTIDPAPYETQVRQAQGNVAMAEERQRHARLEQARGQRLMESNAIARREFDALDNAAREAAAALKAAQATLAYAQLQLSYTKVQAPIAGRVSRAEITVGNVVGAGVRPPYLRG